MGIGLSVEAPIPADPDTGRPLARDMIFRCIAESALQFVRDPLLSKCLEIEQHVHGLYITVHPAAEPVQFRWNAGGSVTASAKTSTVGPGYHAYVVDMLNAIALQCDMPWNWEPVSESGGGDETGYAVTHDFPALQRTMADFIRSLARLFNAKDHCASLMVNMPIHFALPCDDHFVITPMGGFSRQWSLDTADADGERLLELSRAFFPWWNHGLTADFWYNLGMVFLWCHVPWHPPHDEQEFAVYLLTLELLERAEEMCPTLPIPRSEIAELKRLINHDICSGETSPIPSSDGIGYFRRPCSHRLMDNWTFRLPGFYYNEVQNDGSEEVFWFDGRTVRFSAFSFGGEAGQGAVPEDLLVPDPEEVAHGEYVSVEKDTIRGYAMISWDDEQDCWVLAARLACQWKLAVLTICFENASDRDWALSVVDSVQVPCDCC